MKLGKCMKEALVGKIREKKARLVVMGLGRVGLPTAAVLANEGFRVAGVDVRQEILRDVSLGRSHFMEPDLEKMIANAVKNGKLAVTDDPLAVKKADIILICVQTPVTEHRKPDLSYLRKACESIATSLSPGKLVIVKSSVPPGTTRNVVARILEAGSRLRCGEDFWLAHCPERLTPGEALRDFTKNVRIIGGYDETSAEIAAAFYRDQETLITDATTAEVAKLSENTFRDVNIAFANELALMCERIGVDVMEVRKLANTHPRVNIHKPGCGVGGPCLPKDPLLLINSVGAKVARSARIVQSSRELNDFMPLHIVKMVVDALRRAGKRIDNSKIAVLGSAYKKESDQGYN
ncbi:MAG: nucleotide sugar dehydrogenase, partial [Candidatus Thorarchaeota archaeon]